MDPPQQLDPPEQLDRYEVISLQTQNPVVNVECTLKSKTHSKITWRLFFDFQKKAVWVFRRMLTPSQDRFFVDLEIGSRLHIYYSYYLTNKRKNYNLISYRILNPPTPTKLDEIVDQFRGLSLQPKKEKSSEGESLIKNETSIQ